MNRFKSLISKSPIPIIPKTQTTPAINQTSEQAVSDKKLEGLTKQGPELLLTRILMVYGPLQNKEIWRIYGRMQKQNSKLANP